MTTFDLRECDRSKSASNFTAWKCRMKMILEEDKLWEYIEKEIVAPTNPKLLSLHVKKDEKEKTIFLDSVKDHLITHIVEKTIDKEMYDALVG